MVKLEEGKKYWTRRGELKGPIYKHPQMNLYGEKGGNYDNYYPDGTRLSYSETMDDLVEEVIPGKLFIHDLPNEVSIPISGGSLDRIAIARLIYPVMITKYDGVSPDQAAQNAFAYADAFIRAARS